MTPAKNEFRIYDLAHTFFRQLGILSCPVSSAILNQIIVRLSLAEQRFDRRRLNPRSITCHYAKVDTRTAVFSVNLSVPRHCRPALSN